MPYSTPSSPSAAYKASFDLPSTPGNSRRHSSAEQARHASHPSTPDWRSSLPKAAASSSTAPSSASGSSSVKSVLGSGHGAGEVVSPPNAPGMIIPRRTHKKDSHAQAAAESSRPREPSTKSALGLTATVDNNGRSAPAKLTVPAAVDADEADLPVSPSPQPTMRRSSPSRPTSSSPANIHARRGNPANPASLRVDIPTPEGPVSPAVGHTQSAGQAPDRPSPRMVRKKSGEVVKSSLKRRSTSTPSSACPDSAQEEYDEHNGGYIVGRAKSEPPTPHAESAPVTPGTEKKQLRFAGDSDDDEGEQLAKVVLFKRQHKVTAVTRALAGEDVDRIGTDTETETESWWPGRGRSGAAGSSNAAAAARAREKVEMDWPQSTRIPRIPGLNLTVGSSRPLLVPEHDHVVLESVSLVDEGAGANATLNLRGSLVVRNLSFVKQIAIRFTLDNWQTVSEVAASHVVHISAPSLGRADPQGKGWDRFAFTVKLEDYRRKIEESTLLLAIRYTLDGSGEEIWDSLGGQNYRFKFNKTKPAASLSFRGAKGTATTSTSAGGGNAFLPLLESKGISTAPHAAATAARRTTVPSTHAPLVFSRPTPTASTGWTFPSATLSPRPSSSSTSVDSDESPTSTTASSGLPSPVKLKNYASPSIGSTGFNFTPSTAEPMTDSRRSSSSSTSSTSSRASHGRKKTWDASDAFSPVKQAVDVPLKQRPVDVPAPVAAVQPIAIPPPTESGPTMATGLPTPPSSASHSPGSVAASPLPSTPGSPTMMSPRPFELPLQGGSMQPKPRVQPAVRDSKLPSESYADFIDKYCFYRSESSSPPIDPFSPPTTMSSGMSSGMVTPQQQGSGSTSPFSLDMAAALPALSNRQPSSAWAPKAYETITTPTFHTPSPPNTFSTSSSEAFWGRADSSRASTPTQSTKPDHRPMATV